MMNVHPKRVLSGLSASETTSAITNLLSDAKVEDQGLSSEGWGERHDDVGSLLTHRCRFYELQGLQSRCRVLLDRTLYRLLINALSCYIGAEDLDLLQEALSALLQIYLDGADIVELLQGDPILVVRDLQIETCQILTKVL